MEALTQMSMSGEMVEMCVYGSTHTDEYVGGDGGDVCVWKHSHR